MEKKIWHWWRQLKVVILILFTLLFFISGRRYLVNNGSYGSGLLFLWTHFPLQFCKYFQMSAPEFFVRLQARPLARDLFITYARYLKFYHWRLLSDACELETKSKLILVICRSYKPEVLKDFYLSTGQIQVFCFFHSSTLCVDGLWYYM